MADGRRRLPGPMALLVVVLALCLVALAFWLGFLAANDGNSDGILATHEVLRGCAVAVGILAVGAAVARRFARRFEPEGVRSTARFLGWLTLVPPVVLTLFLLFVWAVQRGGHEALSLPDAFLESAIFWAPMFLASALFFALARSQPR